MQKVCLNKHVFGWWWKDMSAMKGKSRGWAEPLRRFGDRETSLSTLSPLCLLLWMQRPKLTIETKDPYKIIEKTMKSPLSASLRNTTCPLGVYPQHFDTSQAATYVWGLCWPSVAGCAAQLWFPQKWHATWNPPACPGRVRGPAPQWAPERESDIRATSLLPL